MRPCTLSTLTVNTVTNYRGFCRATFITHTHKEQQPILKMKQSTIHKKKKPQHPERDKIREITVLRDILHNCIIAKLGEFSMDNGKQERKDKNENNKTRGYCQ